MRRGGVGEARTTGDLSEHPWAGAEVTMRLSATDVAGHAGKRAGQAELPQRVFINPLAKALVEIRRKLMLDPDATRAPALRSSPRCASRRISSARRRASISASAPRKSRLDGAQNDDDLLGVAELLWAMALADRGRRRLADPEGFARRSSRNCATR